MQELLREAKVADLDSIGKAVDHLLRLLEKAEESGNYNAAAQLSRQRLQMHGLLQQRVVLSDESMSDDELIRQLAGDDPEKIAAAKLLLGAPSSFDEAAEMRH